MSKQAVGVVELQDHAMDVLSNYTRDSQFEVILAVSKDPNSQLASMAGILQVPLVPDPTLEDLMRCKVLLMGKKDCIPESWHNKLTEAGVEIRDISGIATPSGNAARHSAAVETDASDFRKQDEDVRQTEADWEDSPSTDQSQHPAVSSSPEAPPALSVVTPENSLGPAAPIRRDHPRSGGAAQENA